MFDLDLFFSSTCWDPAPHGKCLYVINPRGVAKHVRGGVYSRCCLGTGGVPVEKVLAMPNDQIRK